MYMHISTCSASVPFYTRRPFRPSVALFCVLQVPVERLRVPREPPERRPFDLDAAVFLADFAFEAYRVIIVTLSGRHGT